MTKRELRSALGFNKDRELADFFHISKAAVSAWGEAAPVPEGRLWEAMARRPERFPQVKASLNQRLGH